MYTSNINGAKQTSDSEARGLRSVGGKGVGVELGDKNDFEPGSQLKYMYFDYER